MISEDFFQALCLKMLNKIISIHGACLSEYIILVSLKTTIKNIIQSLTIDYLLYISGANEHIVDRLFVNLSVYYSLAYLH